MIRAFSDIDDAELRTALAELAESAAARLTTPLGPEAPADHRGRVPFVSGVVLGAIGAVALKRVGRKAR